MEMRKARDNNIKFIDLHALSLSLSLSDLGSADSRDSFFDSCILVVSMGNQFFLFFAGVDNHTVHRIFGAHIQQLLCLSGRKGRGRAAGTDRLCQLRRRPLVGCGEFEILI